MLEENEFRQEDIEKRKQLRIIYKALKHRYGEKHEYTYQYVQRQFLRQGKSFFLLMKFLEARFNPDSPFKLDECWTYQDEQAL